MHQCYIIYNYIDRILVAWHIRSVITVNLSLSFPVLRENKSPDVKIVSCLIINNKAKKDYWSLRLKYSL